MRPACLRASDRRHPGPLVRVAIRLCVALPALLCARTLATAQPFPEGTEDDRSSAADVRHGLAEGRRLIEAGRFADAEVVARGLFARTESALGADALPAAEVLDLLVESLWRGGRSKESETRRLAERAVSVKAAHLGADDLAVAASLNNLGIVCSDGGDYPAALSAYERALAIRQRLLGSDHPEVARTLNNLGVVALHRGEHAAARALHERALAIRERVLGPDHADVAITLSNLADLAREGGDYAAARTLYERALAIRRAALGRRHPYVATSLAGLAWILAALGDDAAALPLYREALDVAGSGFGPDHPALARILRGYGTLLAARGRDARAREIFERALAIREATHAEDHADVAESLTDLADTLAASGENARAGLLYDRALPIWRQALGPDHPALARALEGLGVLAGRAGDAAKAEGLHARALAIREAALGGDHPSVASSLSRLAGLRLETGEAHRALGDALRAERIAREHLHLVLRSLPERPALRFSGSVPRGLDAALAAAAALRDPAAVRAAWDALIRARALVLDEVAGRQRAAHETLDDRTTDLSRRLGSARARLANLAVRGPGQADPAIHARLLAGASRDKEEAEGRLAEASASFRRDQARWGIGLEAVTAALPEGAALVAFVRYRPPGSVVAPPPRYLAFVLPPGGGDPVAIDLGPAPDLEREVRLLRGHLAESRGRLGRAGRAGERRYRLIAGPLRARVWDPIAPHLGSARVVLIVPDGVLWLLSWAALPAAGGGYLLETGPALHYLSAERDLVPIPRSRVPRSELLAVGDPDFEREPGPERADPSPAATARLRGPDAGDRGEPPACGDFRFLRFAPLPGARAEAERLASLWKPGSERGGPGGVTVLLGPRASEALFKKEAPDHAVLHLATHGFFLGEGCAAAAAAPEAMDNPLLLSGLALAGANRRGRAAAGDGGEDGILTAEEIAGLDLSAVDWAVLPACGSALGQVRAGEGVLGLRRAFRMAGARALVTSLWDVDDATAGRWAEALYRARLDGAGAAEAVRRASLEVLRARREAGLGAHPFFWGGFIAEGDWR